VSRYSSVLKTTIPLIIFAVLPLFYQDSYLLHIFNIIGIYSIAVIGLSLLTGVTGLISLGHAAFFALGGYISAILSTKYGIHPLIALPISCMLSAVFAFLIGMPLIRLKGFYLALGTLGLGIIVYTLINGGGEITGGPNGIGGIPHFNLIFIEFDTYLKNYYLIWITLLLAVLFARKLIDSGTGRALKAIHSDEGTAKFYGISVNMFKINTFILSAVFASWAGVYYAYYSQFITPEVSSLGMSIDMIVMLFLGGVGTIYGPIIGVAVYKMLPEVTSFLHDYDVLLRGVILLIVLMFFPGGIYNGIKRLISRFSRST
jgi:branched-chain amino acid transport system permease protein